MSQEPVLFSTTIANNIKYGMRSLTVNDFDFEIESETNAISSQRKGNEKVTPLKMKETQMQIEEAAKMANAHNFIMKASEYSQTKQESQTR